MNEPLTQFNLAYGDVCALINWAISGNVAQGNMLKGPSLNACRMILSANTHPKMLEALHFDWLPPGAKGADVFLALEAMNKPYFSGILDGHRLTETHRMLYVPSRKVERSRSLYDPKPDLLVSPVFAISEAGGTLSWVCTHCVELPDEHVVHVATPFLGGIAWVSGKVPPSKPIFFGADLTRVLEDIFSDL